MNQAYVSFFLAAIYYRNCSLYNNIRSKKLDHIIIIRLATLKTFAKTLSSSLLKKNLLLLKKTLYKYIFLFVVPRIEVLVFVFSYTKRIFLQNIQKM